MTSGSVYVCVLYYRWTHVWTVVWKTGTGWLMKTRPSRRPFAITNACSATPPRTTAPFSQATDSLTLITAMVRSVSTDRTFTLNTIIILHTGTLCLHCEGRKQKARVIDLAVSRRWYAGAQCAADHTSGLYNRSSACTCSTGHSASLRLLFWLPFRN